MTEYKEAGNQFFKEGKWQKAIDEYTKGLESGGKQQLPSDLRGMLLSNRCQCKLNLKEYQAALEDADAGLQLLPSLTKLLMRRATAYRELGKKSEALIDFAKVAKAEPSNKVAVEETRQLRDEVLRSSQQSRDEILPANLLEVLRKSDSTTESRIESCDKLRALCIHKSLGGSILQAGALDVLLSLAHESETDPKLRASVLGCTATLASGHEVQEEEDSKRPAPPPKFDKPLEASKSALDTRTKLKERLQIGTLRQLCRSNESAMRYLCLILGHISAPEDAEALEVLNDAMQFPEGADVDVPRAGLIALTTLCDTRRRLGTMAKAVMPTAAILKCVESALGCTSCSDLLNNCLACVFALFADKERADKDKIDLAEVGLRILEPFLQSSDDSLKCNGLAGLATLFAASSESAATLLHQSPVPLTTILNTLTHPSHSKEGRMAQSHAAECLLLTTGNMKTRKTFIDGGGIDMILDALCKDEGIKGLVRAKLIGVLAMLAAHNSEHREEVFERLDFLMELRHALEAVKESALAARSGGPGAPTVEEARRLARGLYESIACLTIHGEFKELLQKAKKTLQAMHELATAADLTEDPNIAFMYATIMYNLCRSRKDKQRPKKDQFPFNELGEDDLQALEEFYEKMPAESRPVKNGEVDCGSPELAADFRAWCTESCGGAASVVSNLAKCIVSGSTRVCNLAALTMKFLCAEQKHRRHVVAGGGVRMLLHLVDLEDDTAKDAARQALAQILITTNPALLNYSEQLDAIRPLIDMLTHNHELLKFEAAMGLTNLLSASEEIRARALQANGWQVCRDLLFEENEMIQRAGIEAMCNFTMAPEILERFADGKAELEIRIFCAFCLAEDLATQMAAAGSLAMLASCEEIAPEIAKNEKFDSILQLLKESKNPDLQHRVVACLGSICEASNIPAEVHGKVRDALREARSRGFASQQADSMAKAALEEGGVSGGA